MDNTSSLAERQILPAHGKDTGFPPDQPNEPAERPTIGSDYYWPERELVNYPQAGTRAAVDITPRNWQDFGGPAGAINTADKPGAGITELGPTLNPLVALHSAPRQQKGPALNWQQFVVMAGTDLDTDVGFPVSTFYIDNPTAQFLFIPMCQRWVAPFTLGVVLATQQSGEHVRVRWMAPDGITQPTAVSGQNATVIALERDDIMPAPGYRLDGIAGTNIPNSATQTQQIPTGTRVVASSGNVANANAVATLAGTAGKTTYITGFELSASGSTAALVVTATVAGLIGGVTLSYTFTFPAGVAATATPIIVQFSQPIPANAVNSAIIITLPAGGAGNTNATASAEGFQL